MNVQAPSSPYAPAGATHMTSGNPPVLGAQVPGTTGGLPTLGGLSVQQNPLPQQLRSSGERPTGQPTNLPGQAEIGNPQQAAQQLQQHGRGEDSMLVHMTPNEVNSLRGLAQRFGGDLTTNPSTGLPEAGFLSRILPLLAGIGLNFILPGSGIVAALGGKAATAGLITGVGTTAITGDLQKGLMAGLGAFGGASLAGGVSGALGSGAKAAAATGAKTAATNTAAGAAAGAKAPVSAGLLGQGSVAGPMPIQMAPVMTPSGLAAVSPFPGAAAGAAQAATAAAPAGGFMSQFGNAARGTMGGMLGKAAPMMAGLGVLNTASSALSPSGFRTFDGGTDNSYQGPYRAQARPATFAPSTEELLSSSKERDYFAVDQPEIYNMQGQVTQPGSHTAPGTPIVRSVPVKLTDKQRKRGDAMYTFETFPWMQEQLGQGFAGGGEVQLGDGAFVVDARTVSEIGNGSSNAGIELLSKMGGRPVHGPGDGVSDSVPARIGRDQPARVARDEVIFSPQAVKRVGGGDAQRGAKKLYSLMDKAHAARRKSARGKDTGLRKGLA